MSIQINIRVNAANASLNSPNGESAVRAFQLLERILEVKEGGIEMMQRGQELIDQGNIKGGATFRKMGQERIEQGQNQLERTIVACNKIGIKVPTKYFKV